jgi:GT2 family glycosyltransferase
VLVSCACILILYLYLVPVPCCLFLALAFLPCLFPPILQFLQLSIIIVNYNVRYFLEQCLYAVQRAAEGLGVEIIVVDNGSADGSVNYLRPLFPSVHWLENAENLGFAKANNLALAQCRGEFVLFLNPDTLVAEDTFHKSLGYLGQNPSTGALGVRMLDGKGKFLPESKRSFPSPWVSFGKLSGLSAVFPKSKNFNRYALGYLGEKENHSVEVLAGACMFVRKELLLQLNGFDESYFLYGEDVDLSYRIKKAGYDNIYFANTSIIHFKGESSRNLSLTRVKYFYQAMLVFVQKHYNGGAAKIFSVFLSVAIALRGILSAIKKILKPALLPLTDALLVLISLQSFRFFWINKIRNGEDFNVSFITWAIPLFSLLFVVTAALAGLYEKKYKTSRMLAATAFATICMLAVYSLLPENIRFSRGVILCGGLMGIVLLFLWRQILMLFHSPFLITEKEASGQTVIVSSEKEYIEITKLLEATINAEPLGRVSINKNDTNALCNIADLSSLEKNFAINRIIFCVGENSLVNIIAATAYLSKQHKRFLFYATGSNSIIGSQTLAPGTDVVVPEIDYNIAHPYQKKMKRLLDVKMSVLFLLFFPFHFIFHPHAVAFIKNIFSVLGGSKTWIGYAGSSASLPPLRAGIISSLGNINTGNENLSQKADQLYAKNYDWWQDFLMILARYREL